MRVKLHAVILKSTHSGDNEIMQPDSLTAAMLMKTRHCVPLRRTHVNHIPSLSVCVKYSPLAVKLGTLVMNCHTQLSY
jgi:hypothetical protein